MLAERSKSDIAKAWRTANFIGAAFSGKLKNLSEYLSDSKKIAPQISFEEFDRKFAEKAGEINGAS